MMILISLGISVFFFYSVYALLLNTFGQPSKKVMDFSFELATLILIMLLGRWLEMSAVMKAGVAALLPQTAHLFGENGQLKDVKLAESKLDKKFKFGLVKVFQLMGWSVMALSTMITVVNAMRLRLKKVDQI